MQRLGGGRLILCYRKGMLRLGLCCVFVRAPIRFRRTTYAAIKRWNPARRRETLAALCRHNAEALRQAIEYCAKNGIGAFRVNSQICPLATHPVVGYKLPELPGGREIVETFKACGRFARDVGLRLTFHPDQFVVLNSPRADVVRASVHELVYQAHVSEWIGADVINVHGGGAYGDPDEALARLERAIRKLPGHVRARLTLENDERVFTPAQLIPVCRRVGVPLCYDVHHHRCHPDGWSVEKATEEALATWDREPLFHLSSPLHGWRGPTPERHHDYISPRDFPTAWKSFDLTVEIEAKAKEVAVAKLARYLRRAGVTIREPDWPTKGAT